MILESRALEGPVVSLVARLRAPPAKVFDTWTRPELVAKWFFAETGHRTHDVVIPLEPLGGYHIVVTPDDGGQPTTIHGHFVDVVRDRSLAYTWTGACANEQYWTLVNVRFEPDGETGGTVLRLDHGVFREDQDRAMHEQGWLACLASFERLL